MEFPMEDGLLSMYRPGSDSDAGYGYGGSPSATHSSSSSSSECIHTGSGTGTGPGAGSGSGSDSGLGFLQSLAQWIREHLGTATLSFNFLGAFRSLYLVGLSFVATISTLTEVCFILVSALLMGSDCEITLAIARDAVLSLRQI